MPKGRFGAPRPFSEYRVVIDPHERLVDVMVVGPLGAPRPLARYNPPVEDSEVAECILSDAGQSFGAGVVTRGATTDIADLPPEARQDALAMAEKWCRGSKEAQAVEEIEEEAAIPALSRIRETLANQTGSPDNVTIEMVGTPQEAEEAVAGEI